MKYAFLAFLCICFCGGANAQSKKSKHNQPFVWKPDLSMRLPIMTWRDKNYRVQIERHFANAQEEMLLRRAEALYPARNDVIKAADWRPRQKEVAFPAGALWWYDSFDGVRIPYAVTARGALHYFNLIQQYRGKSPRGLAHFPMKSASLKYVSSIGQHANFTTFVGGKRQFRNVYVAKLQLEWSSYCGNLCALHFNKTRVVIIQNTGDYIVTGDGIESVIVS